jgi:hypothetical protein
VVFYEESMKPGEIKNRIPGFLISSVFGVLRVVSSGILSSYKEHRKPEEGSPKA